MNEDPKIKSAAIKPSMAAVSPVAVLHLAEALQNGSDKYGGFSWRNATIEITRYTDAIYRHLMLYSQGEDIDSDSGLLHLAHIMATCAILLDADAHGTTVDNRVRSEALTTYMRNFMERNK